MRLYQLAGYANYPIRAPHISRQRPYDFEFKGSRATTGIIWENQFHAKARQLGERWLRARQESGSK